MNRNPAWYDLNCSRPYPLVDIAGDERLPHDLIADSAISFPASLGEYAFIGAITVSPSIVSVVILAKTASQPVALGTINLPQPVEQYRHYAIEPMQQGVGGWVVFGHGVLTADEEPQHYKIADPANTRLCEKAARSYRDLPLVSASKLNNTSRLDGLIKLQAGNDFEILRAMRAIPSGAGGASETKEVVIFRLKSTKEYGQSPLAKYVGWCGGRPESNLCDGHQPLETFGGVAPDCDGVVNLEFTGNVRVSQVLHEGSNSVSNLILDTPYDMDDAQANAKYIPTDTGVLPIEQDGLCQQPAGYPCTEYETPEEGLIWVSDGFSQLQSTSPLDASITDGYGHPYNGKIGDGYQWVAGVHYSRDTGNYCDLSSNPSSAEFAMVDETIREFPCDISCEFTPETGVGAVLLGLVCSSSVDPVNASPQDTRTYVYLYHPSGGGWNVYYRAQSSSVAERSVGSAVSASGITLGTKYRFTAQFSSGVVSFAITNGTTVLASGSFTPPSDLQAEWDQLQYAGMRLAYIGTTVDSWMLGDAGTGPGTTTPTAPHGSLPVSDTFSSAGPWVVKEGDFSLDAVAGELESSFASMRNVNTYTPTYGSTGRKVSVVASLQAVGVGARHHFGVLSNYRETTAGSGLYCYWTAGIDWHSVYNDRKLFRIATQSGKSWVTEVAVEVPGLEFYHPYEVSLAVQAGQGNTAWLTATLTDPADSSFSYTLGPLQVKDYLPDTGHFGLLADRAVVKFDTFTVANYP